MALTRLVGSSVLTRLRQPAVRAAVESRAGRGERARAGISDLEIGDSAGGAAQWDQFAEALHPFALVETTSDHMRRGRFNGCSQASIGQAARCLTCSSPPRRKIGVSQSFTTTPISTGSLVLLGNRAGGSCQPVRSTDLTKGTFGKPAGRRDRPVAHGRQTRNTCIYARLARPDQQR